MPLRVYIKCPSPFSIALIGRSGSTHLLHLLNQHPNKIKCIFLHRENNLRGAISKQNFKRIKKKYHTANIEKNRDISLELLNVDVDLAVQETKSRERLNERYSEMLSGDFDTHYILYEDLIENELATLNKCFDFLKVKTISEESLFEHKTERISANRIRDYVSNFDELHQRLKKENLEHYIEMDERC